MADLYLHLNYEDYKAFEEQFKAGTGALETTHMTDDRRFYHKSVRLRLTSNLSLEVHGPAVRGM